MVVCQILTNAELTSSVNMNVSTHWAASTVRVRRAID